MALIIPGRTTCKLCGEVIDETDDVIAFSAFVPNRDDPLYVFNDSAFHRSCFGKHPLAAQASEINQRLREAWNRPNRNCWHCKQALTDPDNSFATGYISQQGELSDFNFLLLHRSCIREWEGLRAFQKAIDSTLASGLWSDRTVLEALKDEISTSLS